MDDTTEAVGASIQTIEYLQMSDEQETGIIVRLERLDAGQRYVIERMGEVSARVAAIEDKLGATREDLRQRVARLEDKDTARDKAWAPWHNLVFSVTGALIVAILTSYLLRHG